MYNLLLLFGITPSRLQLNFIKAITIILKLDINRKMFAISLLHIVMCAGILKKVLNLICT